MKTPEGILGPVETRGDFRRVTESAQRQSRERANGRERLAPVWAGLADAYGNAFTSQFGDEPNDSWVGGLAPHSMEKIMAAVGAIIKSGAQYAPNLASILGVIAKSSNWELARSSRPAAEVLAAPIIDKGADQYLITEIPESDLTKSPKDHMEEMKKGLF